MNAPAPQTHAPHPADGGVVGPSDRAFGLTFAGVLTVVGLLPLVRGGGVRAWALAAAAVFLAAALAWPAVLTPLNRVWLRFGLLLHRVMNPVILGIVFYFVITPMGLLMRLARSRPLKLGFDPAARSYWIPREPPGPEPETMKRQF
ncbi:MAG TPA: SxtJ family membrane protein [Longimicrobium sp.]|nr:SxtJ family membrane protein [Longimicrobium sp.]